MGLFNKLIYGNPNKPDLVVEEKQNPIQSFFEIIKIKIWDLIKLNLLFALFVLPAAIWIGVNIQAVAQPNVSPEAIDSFTFMFFLGLIPCIAIMGIALPSLNYITKSYAKEFHVWMMEDFIEKIKENWKQSLLYSLLLGIMIFVFYFGIRNYTILIDQITGAFLLRAIIYVMGAIVIISTMYAYPLMVTFEMKTKNIIRNSLLLTIGKLPQTLLIILITFIIPILLIWLLMIWNYGIIVFFAYLIFFGFSFPSFIINSYTNKVFEKMIIANANSEAEKKHDVERAEKH